MIEARDAQGRVVGVADQSATGVWIVTIYSTQPRLHDGHFKPKDFRTLKGTSEAESLVKSMPPPKNKTEYRKAVMDVAKAVSVKLGKTPTVALQSYISPTVFSAWGDVK